MINVHDAIQEHSCLLIFNTLDCMLKVMAKVLPCPQGNERAYDVMLPQKGTLS